MRTRLGITIALVILAITGGVLMTTSASGQTVVNVVLPLDGIREVLVDVNRDGLRLGDRIAARGPLLDESQTDRVGTAYAQCLVHKRIISPGRGLWNCNYVLELADGEIVLQGLDPRGPGVYEMAVIGGTGAYAGANGDSTFTDVGIEGVDPNPYTDMVIRLGG
ncbi:MAG: hypothetical protein ACRDKT_01970 [Actinomycetota bacterium]